MTPSEKNAREIEAEKLLDELEGLHDHPSFENKTKVVYALSEAERRGFERSKRMAYELCERERCRNWDSKECGKQIRENLKYEEGV